MVIYTLLALIALRALFVEAQDRTALLFFVAICSIMLGLGALLEPDQFSYYFIFCAFFDLQIITTLSQDKKITETYNLLMILCLGFIYLNLFGFATYTTYTSMSYYNFGCEVLYSSILLFTLREWLNERFRCIRDYCNDNIFPRHHYNSTLQLSRSTEKKRT